METLSSLAQIGKVPVGFTMDAMDMLQNQERMDQFKLSEMQRKEAHERAMDPLRLEEKTLANLTSAQALEEGTFKLAGLGRKERMEQSLFGPAQKAKLQELLAGASDNEAKLFENTLYKRLQQTRPGSPENRAAMAALEQTRGFIAHKQKLAELAVGPNITGRWQDKMNQDNIAAGRWNKPNKLIIGFENELARAQGHLKKLAVVGQYMALAQNDPELAHLIPILNIMREQLRPGAEAEANNAGIKPGEIDLSGMSGIPTIPGRPVAPPAEAASAPVNAASAAQPTQRKPLGAF